MKTITKLYSLCLFIHTTTMKKLLCFVTVVVNIQYSMDCQLWVYYPYTIVGSTRAGGWWAPNTSWELKCLGHTIFYIIVYTMKFVKKRLRYNSLLIFGPQQCGQGLNITVFCHWQELSLEVVICLELFKKTSGSHGIFCHPRKMHTTSFAHLNEGALPWWFNGSCLCFWLH